MNTASHCGKERLDVACRGSEKDAHASNQAGDNLITMTLSQFASI
jgi:hypothetical protein